MKAKQSKEKRRASEMCTEQRAASRTAVSVECECDGDDSGLGCRRISWNGGP